MDLPFQNIAKHWNPSLGPTMNVFIGVSSRKAELPLPSGQKVY